MKADINIYLSDINDEADGQKDLSLSVETAITLRDLLVALLDATVGSA